MSKPRRWLWLVVLLLAAGAIAVGSTVGVRQWKIFRARRDASVLAVVLDGYRSEHGNYPQGSYAEICALLRGQDVNGQNPGKLDYVEAKAYEMNTAGEFIDPWGTPYHIVSGSEPRAYSCGPNRVDEQGGGDDVAP